MTIIKAATYIRLVVHWASLSFCCNKESFPSSQCHMSHVMSTSHAYKSQ